MFQESNKRDYNAFDISHYKTLKQYLSICGINPYQKNRISNILVSVIIFINLTFFGPTVREMHVILFFNDFQHYDCKKLANDKATNRVILLYD